jgi:hypothetical protein
MINNVTRNIISKSKHKAIVFYLTYSIPLVLLFEWLNNLLIIPSGLSVILKAITIVLNFALFISKDFKLGEFKFGKIAVYFVCINLIYAFFSDYVIENLYLTIRILYWVSTTISIFYLYKNNLISIKKLKFIFVGASLLGSLFTIYLMSISETHQNASAYLLLWCLPMLLLFRQTSLLRIVQILAILAIALTVKRGAIIALIISIISYTFGYFLILNNTRAKRRIITRVFGFLLFILFIISSNQNVYKERFSEKTGSGRDVVYTTLIDKYLSSDLDNLIFGYGFKGVENHLARKFYGNNEESGPAAHSDLLQYMFDFGFFGIFVMLSLHLFIINLLRINFKFRSSLFPIILMYYSIFFLTTIYSFILNVPDAIFFGISASIFSEETIRIKRSSYI